MKKLTLILIVATLSAPLFAFDFNEGNFEIDSEIKTQINAAISGEVNNIVIEKGQQQSKSYIEDEILLLITQELQRAQKHVERNSQMRNRFPNKQFIREQKLQKQRYENMFMWNIPEKILEYIKANFDLQKVEHVKAICKYVNETGIDVRFTYGIGESMVVSYTYTDTYWKPSITHKISK